MEFHVSRTKPKVLGCESKGLWWSQDWVVGNVEAHRTVTSAGGRYSWKEMQRYFFQAEERWRYSSERMCTDVVGVCSSWLSCAGMYLWLYDREHILS